MKLTADVIESHKTEWITRIGVLEQEAGSLNARVQEVYTEIQQLRGAAQACDVFLAKLESDIQTITEG